LRQPTATTPKKTNKYEKQKKRLKPKINHLHSLTRRYQTMNIFQTIELTKPKSNTFDLTHDVKMSGRMGNLMPCCIAECVPGDKFTLGSEILIRFAPLIAPVMHRMDATVHYFFVPNRLTWDNWEQFITNEPTGGIPRILSDSTLTADQQRFLDYMGIPPCPVGGTGQLVNAMPLSAYQLIYNEYYRDQNLIPAVTTALTDGVNPVGDLATMRKRSLEHDYFTSSLPFAQKGAAVDIPLGDVTLKANWDASGTPVFRNDADVVTAGAISQVAGGTPQINITGDKQAYDPQDTLEVGATTINELRRAFRLQEWLEKNARGGTRYIENILTHFGVRSSDKRLQRPEYITGVKTPVIVSEVLNTTGESGGLPQGNMAGHAVSVGTGYTGTYNVEEHGYIIGIMSVMPKTAYQQGIPKNYLKTDPTEFYWPSFANIGEQEVTESEIYAYTATPQETFGYIPRYAEYKYLASRVAGDFRTTLDYWHLGRIFASTPTLSQQFLEVTDEDIDRIFAVNDGEDNLYIECLNKISARRPMPVYGTPMF